jgi:hypothetical protein
VEFFKNCGLIGTDSLSTIKKEFSEADSNVGKERKYGMFGNVPKMGSRRS